MNYTRTLSLSYVVDMLPGRGVNFSASELVQPSMDEWVKSYIQSPIIKSIYMLEYTAAETELNLLDMAGCIDSWADSGARAG